MRRNSERCRPGAECSQSTPRTTPAVYGIYGENVDDPSIPF